MPRRPRVFVPGAIYHVYCRVGRSEHVFADAKVVESLLAIMKDVKSIHDFQVFAWCVMPTHYHLALRTGDVPLWRTLRLIQGRFAQRFNRQRRVFGSLWQERYKARIVMSDEYLKQLIAYIHLNPVRAGLAGDPRKYEWSGHRELVGRASSGLVDRDETLGLFAADDAAARAEYLATLASVAASGWAAADPGRLPWWQREPREEPSRPRPPAARPRLDASGASSVRPRPELDAEGFVSRAASVLDSPLDRVTGAVQLHALVRMRDLVALLAVERYALRTADLAPVFHRAPDHVSRWVGRGARRRLSDPSFARELEQLDAGIAGAASGGGRASR